MPTHHPEIDPISLLARLIAAKSYSGREAPAADVLFETLDLAGLNPTRLENNIICTKGDGPRALLFNSHLDTVPATPGWTREPWTPDVVGDRMYGLGSTDAKSCIAAMTAAFAAFTPGPNEKLILTATVEEESGGLQKPNGMETVLPTLGPLAAGIVGEPTDLNICNGQRGLVRIILFAAGRAGHASRPHEGVNAIEIAAMDILALQILARDLQEKFEDSNVGIPTIQATMIKGGSAPNVIPAECEVTLDIRTTSTFNNDAAIEKILHICRSPAQVRSSRFLPVSTPPDSAIVRAARKALPLAAIRPFGGVSDLYHLVRPRAIAPSPPSAQNAPTSGDPPDSGTGLCARAPGPKPQDPRAINTQAPDPNSPTSVPLLCEQCDEPTAQAPRTQNPDPNSPTSDNPPIGGTGLCARAPGDNAPTPAILLGPGNGQQSHTPDEFVSITMVRQAAAAYLAIAQNFWTTTA